MRWGYAACPFRQYGTARIWLIVETRPPVSRTLTGMLSRNSTNLNAVHAWTVLNGVRNVSLMFEKNPAGRGRRFSDMLGLTEQGEPTPKTSPRYLALMGVIFSLMGLLWLVPALIRYSAGSSDLWHLILGFVYIALGVGFIIGWIRSRNRDSDGNG
jgi:hypothetical protein